MKANQESNSENMEGISDKWNENSKTTKLYKWIKGAYYLQHNTTHK